MNDVQDGHENSRDCKGETEGCQRHVLDELCSDWSCLSFLPVSRRVSLSPTFPRFSPFSLSQRSFLSLVRLFPSLESRSVGLDEPTNRAVNGNEAQPKRMMGRSITKNNLISKQRHFKSRGRAGQCLGKNLTKLLARNSISQCFGSAFYTALCDSHLILLIKYLAPRA
ncbi:hypothetical protein PUN28_004734 [Cardiocondyla obscurior]|uniref:Uncharacterized protein n=1 Tax=Cardiocondyla obscurior TaxID=286306 RepID=A0AAW2GF39_9HYME